MLEVWYAACAPTLDGQAHWAGALHVVRPKNCVPNARVVQYAPFRRQLKPSTDFETPLPRMGPHRFMGAKDN